MRKLTVLVLAVAVMLSVSVAGMQGQGIAVYASALVEESEPSPPPDKLFDRDEVNVGDVLAKGTVGEDGQCQVGDLLKDFGMTTTVPTDAPSDSPTKWWSVTVDESCQLVVNGKWEGALEDGPSFITEAQSSFQMGQNGPEIQAPNYRRGESDRLSANLSCKTSTHQAHMYGFGGSWDHLTNVEGNIYWCWDGSDAVIQSESGGCWGNSFMTWQWVVDSCPSPILDWGPTSTVRRLKWGDFHCSPSNQFPCNISNPDGYYHRLNNEITGGANGTASCIAWAQGDYVAGVTKTMVQGCS